MRTASHRSTGQSATKRNAKSKRRKKIGYTSRTSCSLYPFNSLSSKRFAYESILLDSTLFSQESSQIHKQEMPKTSYFLLIKISRKKDFYFNWPQWVNSFYTAMINSAEKQRKKKTRNYYKSWGFFSPLEKHVHQTPAVKNSANICAESAILQSQILKEFVLPLLKHLQEHRWLREEKTIEAMAITPT